MLSHAKHGTGARWRIWARMPAPLSDAQIATLLAEPKPKVDERDLLSRMKPDQNQQNRSSILVAGALQISCGDGLVRCGVAD